MDSVPTEADKSKIRQTRFASTRFDLDRLLSHIDPGPAEESEAFVHLIYERRHIDLHQRQRKALAWTPIVASLADGVSPARSLAHQAKTELRERRASGALH